MRDESAGRRPRTPRGESDRTRHEWRIAYWVLFAIFVLTAALNMLHVRAGFLTSYAADLFLPPWLYIVLRGLAGYRAIRNRFFDWLGSSPLLAAGSLFVGSAVTELCQIRWPRGVFSGTYDPFDLLAYALGLLVCCLIDAWQVRSGAAGSGDRAGVRSGA